MQCRDCPYIAEEFRVLNKRNDEDVIAENGCWCDKIGGRMLWYMTCGDTQSLIKEKKHLTCRKHRTKRERDSLYKKHLQSYAENYKGHFLPCVVPVDKYGATIKSFGHEGPVAYYKRVYKNNKLTKYYKQMANRAVRRYKGELHNGAAYKKCFEYIYCIY